MKKKRNNDLVNVIDLEACCWMSPIPNGQYKEIIEIGITCVDYFTKEITESRSIIVKPEFSEISAFCTKLTTITPELIEKEGVTFKQACKILLSDFSSDERMWMSWGDYDRISMEQESNLKGIKYPLSRTHFNLKEWYAFKYGIKQAPSVSNALKELGLTFEGQCHRGVSDSFNTAKILQKLI